MASLPRPRPLYSMDVDQDEGAELAALTAPAGSRSSWPNAALTTQASSIFAVDASKQSSLWEDMNDATHKEVQDAEALQGSAVHLVGAVLEPTRVLRFPEITDIVERLGSHPAELASTAALLLAALRGELRASAKALTILNEILYPGCAATTLACFQGVEGLQEALSALRGNPDETVRVLSTEILSKVAAHKWELHSFTTPAWCAACGGFLWGAAEQGCQCHLCAEVRCFGCSAAKGGFCPRPHGQKRKRTPSPTTRDSRRRWGLLNSQALLDLDPSVSVAEMQAMFNVSKAHAKRLRKSVCF